MGTPRQRAGFTLTELIIILLIVSALAVFAAPRLNIGIFDTYSFRQEVTNALRYAQKTAVASRCNIVVEIGTDLVEVKVGNNAADACGTDGANLSHPSRGGPFTVEAERQAAISSGTGDVPFNVRGEFEANSDRAIVFNGGGTVTVIAGTGYIDG